MVHSPTIRDKFVKALNVLPYLHHHPNVFITEMATDLGLSVGETTELIDVINNSAIGDHYDETFYLTADYRNPVVVHNDLGLSTPQQLTLTEVNAMLMSLYLLDEMPGIADPATIRTAAEKVRGLVKNNAPAISELPQNEEDFAEMMDSILDPEMVSQLRKSINERRKVAISYVAGSSETVQERVIDPARIFSYDSSSYLAAWEDAVGEHRFFRLDRIHSAEVLSESSNPRINVLEKRVDFSNPFQMKGAKRAHFYLHRSAKWLVDYYPIRLESVDRLASEDWTPASIAMASEEWVIRFALRQSDRIKVYKPQSLVEAIEQRALQGLARYCG